ncbi:hypothetical protein ASC90_25285 [Rhizobium sp. Root1220]|nr:hypothetical protein ASC90_25285 [Rhizobium sp. Root1220]
MTGQARRLSLPGLADGVASISFGLAGRPRLLLSGKGLKSSTLLNLAFAFRTAGVTSFNKRNALGLPGEL